MNKRQIHKFVTWWRQYGAMILFFGLMILIIFDPEKQFMFIAGIISLLYLTVPCGIHIINKNIFLWTIRQLAFLTIGLLYIITSTI